MLWLLLPSFCLGGHLEPAKFPEEQRGKRAWLPIKQTVMRPEPQTVSHLDELIFQAGSSGFNPPNRGTKSLIQRVNLHCVSMKKKTYLIGMELLGGANNHPIQGASTAQPAVHGPRVQLSRGPSSLSYFLLTHALYLFKE